MGQGRHDGPSEGGGRTTRYDFRAPDRFSKDQIRILQTIHTTFGRHFGGSLSAALRCPVHVSFAHIEQSTFGDFAETIPDTMVTVVVTMEPLPARLLLQLDLRVLLSAVDRLLGGNGRPVKVPDDRELTDIEVKLSHSLLDHFLHSLREAWSTVLNVTPAITDISVRRQLLYVALPTEAAVMVMFELRIGEVSGMMSLCLPYEMLKPVAHRLTPQAWITAGLENGNGQSRELLEYQLERVPVEVCALLGTVDLPVRELMSLAVGDVVILDSVATDELQVTVEGEPKFSAWPGLVNNKRAIRIARVLEEDGWL
jgi:flagellar motor switch protein FliM